MTLLSRDLLVAFGGPALCGAALGLQAGAAAVPLFALLLPLAVTGVTLLMIPSLYIGASLVAVGPPVEKVAAAGGRALRDVGTVLAGLAPAAAFLAATSTRADSAATLALSAVGAALVLGMRSLYLELFTACSEKSVLAFASWMLVCFFIVERLVASTFAA